MAETFSKTTSFNELFMRKAILFCASALLLSCILLSASCLRKKAIEQPRNQNWSIGIYTGDSPFTLAPASNTVNPVLKAVDITDRDTLFVADPFMIRNSSKWCMFFELLDKKTNQGDIGVAESMDGLNWQYKQVVLDEPFHLSYPYVFEYNGSYYMIPESHVQNAIRLYQAVAFPTQWKHVANLIEGKPFRDTCIIYFKESWWIFTAATAKDSLSLYYADDLMGPWVEHPKSPIVQNDLNIARPGGRMIVMNNELVRFAQDCDPVYGNSVHAFTITELTRTAYSEKPAAAHPILGPSGAGWNRDGMHQIDAYPLADQSWIACVDGFRMVR